MRANGLRPQGRRLEEAGDFRHGRVAAQNSRPHPVADDGPRHPDVLFPRPGDRPAFREGDPSDFELHLRGLEFLQQLFKALHGKSDHVVVIALEALDERVPDVLDGVAAGLVGVGVPVEIGLDLLRGQGLKRDMRRLVTDDETVVGRPEEGDSRQDAVTPAGQAAEHRRGVLPGFRLAEDLPVQADDRVGGDDQGIREARPDVAGFEDGRFPDEEDRIALIEGALVHAAGNDAEVGEDPAEDLLPAGRPRGQDDVHDAQSRTRVTRTGRTLPARSTLKVTVSPILRLSRMANKSS